MQNFLSLWLNAGAQIIHGGQVQRLRHSTSITHKPTQSFRRTLVQVRMLVLGTWRNGTGSGEGCDPSRIESIEPQRIFLSQEFINHKCANFQTYATLIKSQKPLAFWSHPNLHNNYGSECIWRGYSTIAFARDFSAKLHTKPMDAERVYWGPAAGRVWMPTCTDILTRH